MRCRIPIKICLCLRINSAPLSLAGSEKPIFINTNKALISILASLDWRADNCGSAAAVPWCRESRVRSSWSAPNCQKKSAPIGFKANICPEWQLKRSLLIMTGSGCQDLGSVIWVRREQLLPFHTMPCRKGAMAGTPLGNIHLVGCVNSGNDRDFGSTRAIKRCSKLALYCVFVWSELSQPDKDAKSISVSVWLALCHLTNSNSNSVIR